MQIWIRVFIIQIRDLKDDGGVGVSDHLENQRWKSEPEPESEKNTGVLRISMFEINLN